MQTPWLRRAALACASVVCAGCTTMPFDAMFRSIASDDDIVIVTDEPPLDAARRRQVADDDARAACLAAREMEAHGSERAAIEQYERARSRAPGTKGIAGRLALLYDRQGDHTRAAGEFAAALREDSQNADLWNDFAYFQYERREFADAESAARRALKLAPDHKRACVNLGLALAEQERYDEAYESFAKAVGAAAAHNNLGIILARQGKLADARRELALASQLDPTIKQPAAVLDQLASAKPAGNAQTAPRDGPRLPPIRR